MQFEHASACPGIDYMRLPGTRSKNEQVSVNFGAEPFRFDLAAMVQEEAEQQAAAVQRCAQCV